MKSGLTVVVTEVLVHAARTPVVEPRRRDHTSQRIIREEGHKRRTRALVRDAREAVFVVVVVLVLAVDRVNRSGQTRQGP